MGIKSSDGSIDAKRNAAYSAVSNVESGMRIGLGSGSTVREGVKILGERIGEEALDITAVPASRATEIAMDRHGVPIGETVNTDLDIYIDGADQFDSDLNLIKGGGAAHTSERILAVSADEFHCIADHTKESDALDKPVPIEFIWLAYRHIQDEIDDLGGNAVLREIDGKDGAVTTDNGHPVLDADFGVIENPGELSAELSQVTGVVGHGLFVDSVDALHMGYDDEYEVLTP